MTGQGDAGNRWCLASTAEAAEPLRGNSMCWEPSAEHRDEDRQGGTERGRQHQWLGARVWSRHGRMEHGCVGRGSNKGSEKLLVRSWSKGDEAAKGEGQGTREVISGNTVM